MSLGALGERPGGGALVLPMAMAFGILNGMTLKIDKAGRVILPKPVRDRLGLRAGSDLEMQETAEGIVLKPAERRPSLVKKSGFWVYTGEIPVGYDIVKAIAEDREERIRKVWGL